MRHSERQVVIFGGAGFIGSNVAHSYLSEGRRVLIFDSLCRPGVERNLRWLKEQFGSQVEVEISDIRNAHVVRRAVREAEEVFHFAAQVAVTTSLGGPVHDFEVNARGTLYTLQAAALAGASRFVFASTGGALIGDAPPPVDEESMPRPISPYGASKLAGEGYCHAFRGAYGLPAVALRFANVYGPGSELKRGAVTRFVRAALDGTPITIYGDGAATRDFIHVRDLCAGIVAAHESRDVTGVLHLASERETSIDELARLVVAATGADVPVEHHPPRAGEVERNFASCALARETLGFAPAVELEDGLARTVAWFRTAAGT